MTDKPKLIGVVGGMGPHAGVDFHAKILEETEASADNEHLSIVHMAYQHLITDRVEYLFGKTDVNPAQGVFEVIRQMDGLGVSVLAMPCNTAHAPGIYGVIKERMTEHGLKARLLHMPQEVVAELKRRGGLNRIGVLSTSGTWKTKIYENPLKDAGFEPIVPDWDVQQGIQEAISHPEFGIKAQSTPVTHEALSLLRAGLDQLQAKGAETVLLACTELPLAFPDGRYGELSLEDPTRILARALIRAAHPEKLRGPRK